MRKNMKIYAIILLLVCSGVWVGSTNSYAVELQGEMDIDIHMEVDESDTDEDLPESEILYTCVFSEEEIYEDLIQRILNRETSVYYSLENTKDNKLALWDGFYNYASDEYMESGIYVNNYTEDAVYYGEYDNEQQAQKVEFEFKYIYSEQEMKAYDRKIDTIVKNLNKGSDYEKVKATHDYICECIDYDDTLTNYDDYKGIMEGSTVCQGYAMAFYRLMTEMDIPCRIVSGTADGGSHAWNIVKMDGEWYNVDVTWDDEDMANSYNYTYFLKSDNDFVKHTPKVEYNFPDCARAYESYTYPDMENPTTESITDDYSRAYVKSTVYNDVYTILLSCLIVVVAGSVILVVIANAFIKRK